MNSSVSAHAPEVIKEAVDSKEITATLPMTENPEKLRSQVPWGGVNDHMPKGYVLNSRGVFMQNNNAAPLERYHIQFAHSSHYPRVGA